MPESLDATKPRVSRAVTTRRPLPGSARSGRASCPEASRAPGLRRGPPRGPLLIGVGGVGRQRVMRYRANSSGGELVGDWRLRWGRTTGAGRLAPLPWVGLRSLETQEEVAPRPWGPRAAASQHGRHRQPREDLAASVAVVATEPDVKERQGGREAEARVTTRRPRSPVPTPPSPRPPLPRRQTR